MRDSKIESTIQSKEDVGGTNINPEAHAEGEKAGLLA